MIVALLMMKLPQARREVRVEPLTAQIAAGLRYVLENPPIRTMTLLVAVSSLFGFSYSVLLPAFAVDVLRVGETGLGALNAATGFGALVGSLIVASAGKFRRKGLLLTAGSLVFPATLLFFAFSRSFWISAALLSVVGLAFVTQNATCNTLIQSIVPDSLRGRVMAVYMLMFFGTAPFGALQAGAVAQALGPAMGVVVGAGITLTFAIVILFAAPFLRRVET